MSVRRWSPGLLLPLVATLVAVPAEAKKSKAESPLCAGGRLLVTTKPLIGRGPAGDALRVTAASVTIESGCEPAVAKLRRRGKSTRVTARWRSCAGLKGRVRLTARFDRTCTVLKGTLKTRRYTRTFRARLQGPPTLAMSSFTPAVLSTTVIDAAGGTISVADGPLRGLTIVVPPGATAEPITFAVSWAQVTSLAGLPRHVQVAGPLVRIETTGSAAWNGHRMFDRPIRVTLPYAAPTTGEETVRYYQVDPDGMLEPTGLERQDLAAHTLTFLTRTFADTAAPVLPAPASVAAAVAGPRPLSVGSRLTYAAYVALGFGEALAAYLASGRAIDTGFLPSANGWFITNYGSYYRQSRGGNCFGMVGAAKHYHARTFAPRLYDSYRDDQRTPAWSDDVVAIEYVSRVHNGLGTLWSDMWSAEAAGQSQRGTLLSLLSALDITGAPALLYIAQLVPGVGGAAPTLTGAHAISVYRATIAPNGAVTLFVYDPNFPGNDGRSFTYTTGTGFSIYDSGPTAAASVFQYNYFRHINFYVGMTNAELDAIKSAADSRFADASIFPRVTIRKITGATNGEVVYDAATGAVKSVLTQHGDFKYVTSDRSVRVEGTILGGLAQDPCCVVNNAHVFVSGQSSVATAVNNVAGGGDGRFTATVPLLQGENDFVIIGAGATVFNEWAAFYRTVIESTATPAALTVTLTWDADASDVDLYVREPNTEPGVTPAKTGDTVYFSHRKGESTLHPYLDLDDTRGHGPEHYFARVGMTSLYTDGTAAADLYGVYRVRAHYYGDHDDDPDRDQTIGCDFRWRYLAYCPDPCVNPEADGFWVEGSFYDTIDTATGSSNCCDITRNGPDWTDSFILEYPKPDPNRWRVPPPAAVMLP